MEKLEKTILDNYQSVPFHNFSLLGNHPVDQPHWGGTCSDKTIYFQKVLEQLATTPKLHTALINGQECHRLLALVYDTETYFIDVGTGWPCTKPIPASRPVRFSAYGIDFRSTLKDQFVSLEIRTAKEFKPLMEIPLQPKPESEILQDIARRFDGETEYPFQNSLRYSIALPGKFIFIKNNLERQYSKGEIPTERVVSHSEVRRTVATNSPYLLNLFDRIPRRYFN